MLSIVIITLNEEKNIGNLLTDISKQTYTDLEIFVIDSKSKDTTQKIAKSFKKIIPRLTVHTLQNPGICNGRNKGAELSKGEYIFFLDADVRLDPDFIKMNYQELKKRKLQVAGVYLNPIEKGFLLGFYYSFLNFWFKISEKIYPHCVGSAMIATPKVHKTINGFDNTITLAEDNDYVNRAAKKFKFGVVHKRVNVSTRRFKEENNIILLSKYILVFFYRIFFGEVRSDIFHYKFGHYGKK